NGYPLVDIPGQRQESRWQARRTRPTSAANGRRSLPGGGGRDRNSVGVPCERVRLPGRLEARQCYALSVDIGTSLEPLVLEFAFKFQIGDDDVAIGLDAWDVLVRVEENAGLDFLGAAEVEI